MLNFCVLSPGRWGRVQGARGGHMRHLGRLVERKSAIYKIRCRIALRGTPGRAKSEYPALHWDLGISLVAMHLVVAGMGYACVWATRDQKKKSVDRENLFLDHFRTILGTQKVPFCSFQVLLE